MLRIRLSMGGVRKRPIYKIVIADGRYPRDGKFIEKIGSYNPLLPKDKKERENPKIISGSRRKRISNGAGVDVSKINKLLKQFKMMSEMMKKMSQGKKIPSGMIPDEMLNQLK